MYTVASLLKQSRQQLGFSPEEASRKIKTPLRYLLAFENEKYQDYPSEPYCSFHVRNYAGFLGLNQDNILALFRRDYESFQSKSHIPKMHTDILTPQRVFKLGLMLIISVFTLYIYYSYSQFNKPPKLVVNWPQPPVLQNSIQLNGYTSDDATIRINQDLVIVTDGKFSKELFLGSGDNQITVEAKGRNGKIIKDSRTIQKP